MEVECCSFSPGMGGEMKELPSSGFEELGVFVSSFKSWRYVSWLRELWGECREVRGAAGHCEECRCPLTFCFLRGGQDFSGGFCCLTGAA